ncbi:cytochrome P450 [Streptomyces sp. P1-3]|uniref:cytochrome P450 n=1 Tax=Streptomyces sp. P1-3 TaxID=3421658 RepID=UPI003D36AB9F
MSRPAVELTPEQVSDPIHGYTALREEGPLARVVLPGTETPVWLATRYEDVKALTNDPRFVRDVSKLNLEGPNPHEEMVKAYGLPLEYREYLTSLVILDGPEHARMRSKVTRTFTVRRVNALRAGVEETADELLNSLAGGEQFDLMHDFGYLLANRAICDLIGVERADQDQMRTWILQYAFGSDPAECLAGLEGIIGYTKELIKRRRAEPADDIISTMIADEDPTTDAEMVAMVILLINTGHTPPVTYLCESLLTLLDHPDQLELLRSQPELLPNAIHELLRYTTPVNIGATVYATEDLEFAGVKISRGEAVTSALLAGNHDPDEFQKPEELDISRAPKHGEHHVAFGGGAHYCLGAALGRMEAEVVFDRLLIKRDTLRLAVGRDELQFGAWPGEGNHLMSFPVRL